MNELDRGRRPDEHWGHPDSERALETVVLACRADGAAVVEFDDAQGWTLLARAVAERTSVELDVLPELITMIGASPPVEMTLASPAAAAVRDLMAESSIGSLAAIDVPGRAGRRALLVVVSHETSDQLSSQRLAMLQAILSLPRALGEAVSSGLDEDAGPEACAIFESIIGRLPLALALIDADGVVRSVGGAMLDHFGIDPREALGTITPGSEVEVAVRDALGGDSSRLTVSTHGITLEAWAFPIETDDHVVVGACVVAVAVRRTEPVSVEARPEMSTIESVVRLVADELESPRVDNAELALFLVDLGHLDQLVDWFGRGAASEVVQSVSARLEEWGGDGTTVTRLEPASFAVLADVDSRIAVDQLADALATTLEEPIAVGDREYRPAVTIGVRLAVAPDDGGEDTADTLVRDAELAVATARGRAERIAVWDRDARRQAARRDQHDEALAGAIEGGQLELLYAPVFALADAQPVGFETVVRWHHPELGPVDPVAVLSVGDPYGRAGWTPSIASLGEWHLRTVGDVVSEGGQGIVTMALPSGYVADPRFLADLDRELDRTGVAPDAIAVAVEATAHGRLAGALDRVVANLAERGVGVAIHGFSAADLGAVPSSVRAVALDPAITGGESDRAVAQATVVLAHARGLTVTAEHVDSDDQLDVVREIGCDLAVGRALALPIDAPNVAAVAPRQAPSSTAYEQALTETFARYGALDRDVMAVRRRARQVQSGRVAEQGGGRVPLAKLATLTDREWDVLIPLASGFRVPTIARAHFLSEHTVRNHLKSVFRKLGVGSQVELLEEMAAFRPR